MSMQNESRLKLILKLASFFYRSDRKNARIALTCSALVGIAEYVEPYLFGQVMNLISGSVGENIDHSIQLIMIAWILLTVFLVWCTRTMSLCLQDVAQQGSRVLWTSYLSNLYQNLSYVDSKKIHSTRVLKTGIVGTNAGSEIWQVFAQEQFQTLIGISIMLPIAFLINSSLASILVFLVLVALIVLHRNIRVTGAAEEVIESLEGNVAEHASELIRHRDLIKTSRATFREMDKFDRLLSTLRTRYQLVARIWATATAAIRGVFSFSMLLMLLAGVWLYKNGLANIGEIVTFVGILGYVLVKVETITDSLRRVSARLPAVREFLDIPKMDLSKARQFKISEELINPNINLENEFSKVNSVYLEFDNVSFQYVDDQPVLNAVNFTVDKYSIVGISGNSGIGKTTLMHLLMGLLHPCKGTIRFNGIDLKRIDSQDWWRRVAIVFQDSELLSKTIEENLRLTNENVTAIEIESVLSEIGLQDKINNLKDAYKTQVGEIGQFFSGGQRQLLNIARALLARPEIMLLDEPTGSLDKDSEKLVLDAIVKLRERCTVILISHRSSTLSIADKIIQILNNDETGASAFSGEYNSTLKINKDRSYAL